jgi:hypothetical protein
MIRAILEDLRDIAALALFLAALALILAPCDAQALTPEAADRGGYWFAGAVLIFAVIAFAIRAAVLGIGRDAAAHDDNMAAALRAESIKGDDR